MKKFMILKIKYLFTVPWDLKIQKKYFKKITVDKKYQLAFYLALGDGIEASLDQESPVIWNNIKSSRILYFSRKYNTCY